MCLKLQYICARDNTTHTLWLYVCCAYAFMTHIDNLQKAITEFCNIQHAAILATHKTHGRDSSVEEEVDWHEYYPSVPGSALEDTPPPLPTHVLELKVLTPTCWSSLFI